MTIQVSSLNESLGSKLAVYDGCSTLAQCFTCGACSGACPVEKVVPAFDPRKIVHMVALGMEDALMGSDIIWACSQCQSCVPVCPQNVRCSDVIKALRSEALSRGVVDRKCLGALGIFAEVDAGRCVACLTCVRLCPFGAPGVVSEGYAFIDPGKCKACGICVQECPAQAITLAPSQEYRGMMEGKDVN
ncbi:MAG: 4Fe-4S binding protein [Desulfobacteraceae bacterium]|nr:4Fe-4S binding protein [Desulfobacteraceae bacterium]